MRPRQLVAVVFLGVALAAPAAFATDRPTAPGGRSLTRVFAGASFAAGAVGLGLVARWLSRRAALQEAEEILAREFDALDDEGAE